MCAVDKKRMRMMEIALRYLHALISSSVPVTALTEPSGTPSHEMRHGRRTNRINERLQTAVDPGSACRARTHAKTNNLGRAKAAGGITTDWKNLWVYG